MTDALAARSTAMVLAAGYGTRLAPLTATRAKAVVPFLNRPLLDYTLDWLRRCGFREVVMNLHHQPESVMRRYRSESFDLDIHFNVEASILGTAGGPRAVIERLAERVLIVNGDVLSSMALGPLWQHHRNTGALATMALYTGSGAGDYPGLVVDESGRIRHIPGLRIPGAAEGWADEAAAGCFAGIHIVERSVLELVPEGVFCGMVDPIYAGLLEQDLPLHGVVVPGSWYEIGNPTRYRECQLEALRREDFPIAFDGYRRVGPSSWVRGLVGSERAGLLPPFMLDRGVHVGKGALVEGLVAGARACIGRGATVKDSVLLERAWVGTGAHIERCVVLEDAAVPDGARLTDTVVGVDSALPAG